jgi:hypothetical protein
VADSLSPEEAQWILGRAAELDAREARRLDLDAVRAAAHEAGLSEQAIEQAIGEAKAGAIDAAARRQREWRGVLLRGGLATAALVAAGTAGLVQGPNLGDLIPFALVAWPATYVRNRFRQLYG